MAPLLNRPAAAMSVYRAFSTNSAELGNNSSSLLVVIVVFMCLVVEWANKL